MESSLYWIFGRALSEALDGLATRKRFPVHPDHKAPIEVSSCRWWVRPCARRTMPDRFPAFELRRNRCAVTPTGPSILELNVQPGRNGAVYGNMPTKDVFQF